jgi:hypothetical protein
MAIGAFLGSAKSRLLPASIPFRFFGAAVVFHIFAWLALAVGAQLAALHLITLGVLVMTAMGAGAQLLPVATRQGAPDQRWLAATWWVMTPGVALLTLGMGLARPPLLGAGAAAVSLALAAWAMLMARNLLGARGMRGVVAHGWLALAALAVTLASALSLVAMWLGWAAPSRDIVIALHRVFAPYGFMGMLALGLSYILVPMFALADAPPERRQLISCAFAALALVLAGVAAFGVAQTPLRVVALAAAAAAIVVHLHEMLAAMRSGMRRDLGRSFVLVKIGWGALAASLLLALALVLELPIPGLPMLFGLCVIAGWLLSFLLGMLQRIAPFLAAMHSSGKGRRAKTPSALTHDAALRVHFFAHVTALALLAFAAVTGDAWLAAAGCAAGLAGAVAFAFFFATVIRRARQQPV